MELQEALQAQIVSAEDLAVLLDATGRMSEVRTIEQLAAIVRVAARRLSGADGVTFVLREDDQVYYLDEDAISPLWKGRRFPAGSCISGWAIVHRVTVVIEDIYADPRIPHDAYRPTFVKSLVMTPVGAEEPVGAIGAYWAAVRRPDEREVMLLAALANACATAFVNIHLIQHLIVAREAAEASARAKDELFAMLGHELRNPLAPITSALELIRLRSELRHLREIAVIDRQVRHLGRLVDDLLDASRSKVGSLQLARAPLEVDGVVGAALEQVGPLLRERRHRLEIVSAAPGVRVLGDAPRLVQALCNLLVNAARYTEPGGVITVAVERDGDDAIIRVRDTGVGIAPELLPNLFGMFVQGPRAIDRREGGLGLGLALVRAIVEQHGGAVAAHSDGPGRGTELVVRLPALASGTHAAPVELAGASRRGRARRAGDVRSRRVLVVDDNTDAAEMLTELLRDFGHTVAAARDGDEALTVAARFLPEVAILDIGLPVMDGYELAERLRTLGMSQPPYLIAVTGHGHEHDRARSRSAGFDVHMLKPVDIDQLAEAILTDRAS